MNELVKEANKQRDTDTCLTSDRRKAVKIRLGAEGASSAEPLSVPGLLANTVTEFPNVIALRYKNSDNEWESVTYK